MAGSETVEVKEVGPTVDISSGSVTEPAQKEATEIPKAKQLSQKEQRARAHAGALSGCQAVPPQEFGWPREDQKQAKQGRITESSP
jgi:hypothetical protein